MGLLKRLKIRRNSPKNVAKRQKRRDRWASLVGLVLGSMLNTRWIGWIVAVIVALIGLIIAGKVFLL